MTNVQTKRLTYRRTPTCLIDDDGFCGTHGGRHPRITMAELHGWLQYASLISLIFAAGMAAGIVSR